MKEQTLIKDIIRYVANHRMVKYIQVVELSSFLVSGFLVSISYGASATMLLAGIFFAMITGEAALLEHELKKGNKNGC